MILRYDDKYVYFNYSIKKIIIHQLNSIDIVITMPGTLIDEAIILDKFLKKSFFFLINIEYF